MAAYIWRANPEYWHSERDLQSYIQGMYVYWSTPQHYARICAGDDAYVYVSKRGVVAVGKVRSGLPLILLEGHVRMRDLVWSSDAGVFEALRDPAVFTQAYVSLGAVTWPGEIDLAPDAMHDEIEAHGEWVLG